MLRSRSRARVTRAGSVRCGQCARKMSDRRNGLQRWPLTMCSRNALRSHVSRAA